MSDISRRNRRKTQKGKGLVPALRFPEFRGEGEWDIGLLGNEDISIFVKERVALSQLNIETYISTDNLLSDYAGVTNASKLPPTGSFTRYKKSDVLVSNIRPYLKKVWSSDKEGACSNDVIVIRAGKRVKGNFLTFILKNDAFINYVMRGAKGVKMPRGDLSSIKEYFVAFPETKEQQKIADCLSSLDELITLQTQKRDAFKAHKKGLMQQLFPAEGETQPKLRFPEFDEDLKSVNFSELGEIKIGLTHKPDYIKSGKPFLSSKNISNGYIDFENIKYISEEKFSSMPESTKPKVGDILFTRVGSNLGNPIILEEDREFGIFVSLGIFRVNNKVSNYYIRHWMDSDYFWVQVKQKVAGGAKDNLNTTWLKEFKLSIPLLSEQQKIADCLTNIDDLITKQTKEIDALKSHKKGLMQQLFPSMDDDCMDAEDRVTQDDKTEAGA